MLKKLRWISSAKKDLQKLPKDVQSSFGYVLYRVQLGENHAKIKPLIGFGGASVLEIVEDFEGNAYRAVYTTKIKEFIYVLHVFQKKSKQGISTPKQDIELIKQRLKIAVEDYERRNS